MMRPLVPCGCGAPTRPGLVLDPFAGSGTTLKVARELGRDALGIELASAVRRAWPVSAPAWPRPSWRRPRDVRVDELTGRWKEQPLFLPADTAIHRKEVHHDEGRGGLHPRRAARRQRHDQKADAFKQLAKEYGQPLELDPRRVLPAHRPPDRRDWREPGAPAPRRRETTPGGRPSRRPSRASSGRSQSDRSRGRGGRAAGRRGQGRVRRAQGLAE